MNGDLSASGPAGRRAIDLLAAIEPGPPDGILLSMEQFAADPRPDKVNLGVGMYYDDEGRIPVMQAIRTANDHLAHVAGPRSYIPAEGLPGFRSRIERLLFGSDCVALREGRVATVQGLGGTGALKLAADLLAEMLASPRVAVSDPTWPNHAPLLADAGLQPEPYPYYDRATGELDIDGLCDALAALPPRTPVLLHACCHNPTGVDPTEDQWRRIAGVLTAGDLIPFIDAAYLGFGRGLEADAYAIRLLADSGLPLFVAASCSKNFSIYGERVGSLSIVAASRADAERVVARLKTLVRSSYSTPPLHGAALVAHILATPGLEAQWRDELEVMRQRIVAMRAALAERLSGNAGLLDYGFLTRQHGLFSFSRLKPAQVQQLQDAFGIYAVNDGRLCMAAINPRNLDTVADAIRQLLLSDPEETA